MYFLTKQDPNYTVKGSRDPLGFQVLWQAAGRKLIPHLSTVCGTVKDFQILSTAYYLKNELKIEDKAFARFFLLFEQLMAYSRYYTNTDEGFNGIDKVKKVFNSISKEVRISINHPLLSNQRAYGIWGKYIRPFMDMGIKDAAGFHDIYQAKVGSNLDLLKQAASFREKAENYVFHVNLTRLPAFASVFTKPAATEKELYVSKLLSDEYGNELLRIFSCQPKLKKLSLYELLAALEQYTTNSRLKAVVQYIHNTEKVLCPLNRIFRYLQTHSFWKRTELDCDRYIQLWRTEVDISGFPPEMKELSDLLNLSNWDLIQGLVKRHEKVCSNRGSAPWIKATPLGIDLNHFEGAYLRDDYDPTRDWDNTYFLYTYINLHNQLN